MANLSKQSLEQLQDEMRNFEGMLKEIHPSSGALPKIAGFDIFGMELPLIGGCGGDHIIFIDFERMFNLSRRIEQANRTHPEVADRLVQNRHRAGLLLADAAGHRCTDALHVAMLHLAFLSCIPYELDTSGMITNGLFENLNTGFFHTISATKFITMIYGEISDDGRFRFLSAGHPPPLVFSKRFDRIMEIGENLMVACQPLGMLPSSASIDGQATRSLLGHKKAYTTNQIELLGEGDILLLYSDGLLEHGADAFFPGEVEALLREAGALSAFEICERIKESISTFAPQVDDISYIIVKKTA